MGNELKGGKRGKKLLIERLVGANVLFGNWEKGVGIGWDFKVKLVVGVWFLNSSTFEWYIIEAPH